MKASEDSGQLVSYGPEAASPRPTGGGGQWRGWPFGKRRRRRRRCPTPTTKMQCEQSLMPSVDAAGGDQEQEAGGGRQQRERRCRRDNDNEATGGRISERRQWFAAVAGEAERSHWPVYNNGSGSPTAGGNHSALGQPTSASASPSPSPSPSQEDDSMPNEKISFRQYLPSCSFNLNDHTPRESNNRLAARQPSSASGATSDAASTAASSRQTEAESDEAACEFAPANRRRRAVKGEGGACEKLDQEREEKEEEEEAAAQVDDEKINFARTKQQQQCRWSDKSSSNINASRAGCNNELSPESRKREQKRAGPNSSQRKRADVAEPPSGSSLAPPLLLAKSIASAWSRLKISPNGRRRDSTSSVRKSELLLNNNNNQNNNELEVVEDSGELREQARGQDEPLCRERAGAQERRRSKQSVLEIRRCELEVLKLRQQQQQQQQQLEHSQRATFAFVQPAPIKRKGFLHSKQDTSKLVLASSASGGSASACKQTLNQQSQIRSTKINAANKSVRSKLTIDLNNNLTSATSLASNLNQRLSNYAQQLSKSSSSRRGTRESDCLLEEEEEEQFEEVKLKAQDLGRPKMCTPIKGERREEEAARMRSNQQHCKKMSPKAVATKRRAKDASGRDESSLLLAASSAIWLFLVLAGAQLVLGQQPAVPFTRSQRPQAAPVGPPLPMSSNPNLAPPVGRGGAPLVAPATGSLVANISCNKIRGHVTLTPNLEGGATVTTQISAGPPGEVYQWSIHQFPIKPGAAMCTCSSLILGSKLVDLSEMHGNLPSDQEFSVQSSLQLFDFESPVGHSLLLRGIKTGMVACGTFLPTNRKSNYRAKFHMPLSGSVTIFQTSFGTSFLSHLMYSNGTRRHSMHRFDLVRSDDDLITSSLLSEGQQLGAGGGSPAPVRSNIEQLEQREHENELQACKRFSTGEPLFKNLTYQLSVSTENFGMRGRTALVLPQIPFETFSSVYVVVYSEYDPNEPIACAPLRFVKAKTAAAKFQTNSVQGSIVFSQDSPYDVTVARVSLNFPNSDGHSYGIDELPMIIRRKSDTRVCPNIREIIYNPHHIEPSSVPAEGEATSDQYAVGDLSGKYGSLTGKASERITAADHNLPLFGPVSIIGRALTIYSGEGVAIACSNVELTTPMTTAFATFDYGIQGQFIFRQPMNDCNGDTYVYIEVSKPNTPGSGQQDKQQQQQAVASLAGAGAGHDHSSHLQTRSLDHNWHIHVNPVDSGVEHLSTTECSLAGPHYNPYNTSTTTIYSRDCTPFNVLRCELGDLSSKMFTIEIPPYKVKSGGQEPDIGKFFGTDIELPLCGPTSIVNRSVVVHVADFGTQRLACSTVIEFKPRN